LTLVKNQNLAGTKGASREVCKDCLARLQGTQLVTPIVDIWSRLNCEQRKKQKKGFHKAIQDLLFAEFRGKTAANDKLKYSNMLARPMFRLIFFLIVSTAADLSYSPSSSSSSSSSPNAVTVEKASRTCLAYAIPRFQRACIDDSHMNRASGVSPHKYHHQELDELCTMVPDRRRVTEGDHKAPAEQGCMHDSVLYS
jgi:hypothetical protein